MAFSKHAFGLFFSLPPDATDYRNLELSGCTLVMLPMEFADRVTLARLKERGQRVILRVSEGAYYQDDAPDRIAAHVAVARDTCPVEAVIVGNESESALSFEYGSNTWGQQFAFVHRRRFDSVRVKLQGMGVKVISPAFTCRMLTESDKPQPGEHAWWDICTDAELSYTEAQGQFGYHSADGCGGHVYTHNWLGPVDELRIAFMLQRLISMWHKPIWIDELGVNSGTQIERMQCYIDIAQMLLDRDYPYGSRVECLIPFVASGDPGNPPAWKPGYLIRDPKAYELLGAFLRS